MLKKMIPYLSLVLFLLLNPLIDLLSPNDLDQVKYEELQLENASLKKEIEELSNISYTNYDYKIAKILVKNLYNSNTYFLYSNESIAPKHPVINKYGLIGITNKDSTLITLNDLTISVKVDGMSGILKNKKIFLDTNNLPVAETPVYTSGLTNFPPNLKIGRISSCEVKDTGVFCSLEENPIDTVYCLILEEYSI